MDFDFDKSIDAIKDGIKEAADFGHEKISEFHKNYISKILPDCGKYGDAAKFAAELAPGVSEYNAIKEGNWKEFAIAAGVDIGAIAVGAFTAGAGYAAVKGGSVAAKAGVKAATKEVAEVGAKKAIKGTAETGAKKAAKESVEGGAEKAVKETAEAKSEKTAKEVAEEGSEKAEKKYLTTSEERKKLASSSKGTWDGESGNSKLYPEEKEVNDVLSKHGVDGIVYRDGDPDFSVVADSIVKIDNMTSKRLSNFSQADKLCAREWNEIKKGGRSDWTISKVKAWRHENMYTWHERLDKETMDLVPRVINDKCRHYGGVAECRRLEMKKGGGFDE